MNNKKKVRFLLSALLAAFSYTSVSSQSFGAPVVVHPAEQQVNYVDGSIGANSNNYSAAGSFENYASFEESFVSYGGKDIILTSQGSASLYGFSQRAGGKGDDECLAMRQIGTNFVLCGYFSDTATFGSTTVISKGGKDIFIASYTNAGVFNWVRAYGSTGDDWAVSISNGNPASQIIVGINYSGTLIAGNDTVHCNGVSDAGVIKISTSGSLTDAVKLFGGPGEDRLNHCQWSSTTIFCTGSFSDSLQLGSNVATSNGGKDFIVLSSDPLTGPLWYYTNGGAGNDEAGEFFLQNGNIQLIGNFEQSWTEGAATFTSAGMQDCFYYQYNFTTGAPVNGFCYGGPGQDTVTSLHWDGTLSLLTLAGSFEQTMVLDMVTLVSAGMSDAYLVQTDIYGLFNSGERYGQTGDDVFNGAWFSSSNMEFYAWGSFSRGSYPYPQGYPYPIEHYGVVQKYNFSYNFLTGSPTVWGSTAEIAVDQDAYGNHYVTAEYHGCITFDTVELRGTGGHTVVAKYDPAGNLVWIRTSIDVADNGQTTTPSSGGQFIKVSPTGYSYVIGNFRSKCTFGSTVLTPMYENSSADGDAFMVCYDPAGTVVFAKRIASNTNGVTLKSLSLNTNLQALVSGYWTTGTLQLEGSQTLTAIGQRHGFLLRYTAIGSLGASVRVGGTGATVWMDEATIDNSNNMYAIGYFDGNALSDLGLTTNDPNNYNTYIAKYNQAGVPQWTQNIQATSGNYSDYGGIVFDSVAGLFVKGPFGLPVMLPNGDQYTDMTNGTFDLWLARVDLNGNFLWSNHMRCIGLWGAFSPRGMASDNNGKGVITFSHDDSLYIDQYYVPDNPGGTRESVYTFDMQGNLINLYTEPERGLNDLMVGNNCRGRITYYGTLTHPFSTIGTDTMFSNVANNECFYLDDLDSCRLAQFNYSESGGIFQFTNTTVNADSVLWNFGDGNFSTGNNPTHMYSSTGTFTVTLVAWTNCGPDTSSAVVTWNPLAVTGPEHAVVVQVFPNPAQGQVTVSAGSPIALVNLYNSEGQLLRSESGRQQTLFYIDLNDAANGMFIVEIYFNDGSRHASRIYKSE